MTLADPLKADYWYLMHDCHEYFRTSLRRVLVLHDEHLLFIFLILSCFVYHASLPTLGRPIHVQIILKQINMHFKDLHKLFRQHGEEDFNLFVLFNLL